ncbi:hypothetical protein F4808DRAFT_284034 [Astrocystis sublimbata]|nr:hypothetical protein F4808DRAFT_284034 [Astrocystis sublimbata]
MSTPKGKTNFKTYEASTRLLAAVIATSNVKLDYNEIAKHVGRGVGVDAINHRFRPIKKLAQMQAACVKEGGDPGLLPTEKGALAAVVGGGATAAGLEHRFRPIKQLAKLQLTYRDNGEDPAEAPVEKGEIQKLFGESTPSGIEWQFREIKNLGKAQQAAVKNNDNPAMVNVPGTPSAGRGRGRPVGTPGSGASARTPGTGTRNRKRKEPEVLLPIDSSDGEAGTDDNDSDVGMNTPSKRPTKRAATMPSVKKTTTTPGTAAPRPSIFGGGGGAAPATTQYIDPFDGIQMFPFHGEERPSWTPKASEGTTTEHDRGVGANSFNDSVNPASYEADYEEGEI